MSQTPAPYMGQDARSPYAKGEIVRRLLWDLVQATLFRWSPRHLHSWRIFLLRLFGARVPFSATIQIFPSVVTTFPWKLTVEEGVTVGPGVRLYNLAPITLRYGAKISQHSHLCAGTHDYSHWSMPLLAQPIILERNVWLGTEVYVGPGVTVGELAVVGARSVVVKDLPPRMVCAGHPCRPLKPRADPS